MGNAILIKLYIKKYKIFLIPFQKITQQIKKISSLKKNIENIVKNYDNLLDRKKSYIKNNDLKQNIILDHKDFLLFACKSKFGGSTLGSIGINSHDLQLYILKDSFKINAFKIQDECFLNMITKEIMKNYYPIETYLVNNRTTAVKFLHGANDLKKLIFKKANKDYCYCEPQYIKKIHNSTDKFFKQLEQKKVYGLISSIITMELIMNWDIITENIMIQNIKDDFLFFFIDPVFWSQNNRYGLDLKEFRKKINQAFKSFEQSIYLDFLDFRRQLIYLLCSLLRITCDGVLEKILSGITNKDKQYLFDRYLEKETDEWPTKLLLSTQTTIYKLIQYLPSLVSQLNDSEILTELNVFVKVDIKKIETLYKKFYYKNSTIAKIANNKKQNLSKGVQRNLIQHIEKNLIYIQKKLKMINYY